MSLRNDRAVEPLQAQTSFSSLLGHEPHERVINLFFPKHETRKGYLYGKLTYYQLGKAVKESKLIELSKSYIEAFEKGDPLHRKILKEMGNVVDMYKEIEEPANHDR